MPASFNLVPPPPHPPSPPHVQGWPANLLLSVHVSCPAVIEKYTRSTRFCLICNYVSKIIPALQSRCTRFRFPPLAEACVRERLQFVADQEK